jgi:hypothetical protein
MHFMYQPTFFQIEKEQLYYEPSLHMNYIYVAWKLHMS